LCASSACTLPKDITPADYVQDFETYSSVLSSVVPHVPLYAPALANPNADLSWIKALLAARHPGLGTVSGHRYPYSACAFPDSPQFPTMDRILSEDATVGMAHSVERPVEAAHRAALPFVLTEFNSITCGGLDPVSNAFATALWAPDAVFELEQAGVRAVHLHARQTTINDPFRFDGPRFVAHPLLYGLILFARTLGPDARLVRTQFHGPRPPHLKVLSYRVPSDGAERQLVSRSSSAITLARRRSSGSGPAWVPWPVIVLCSSIVPVTAMNAWAVASRMTVA
jgi:hypothetical protein